MLLHFLLAEEKEKEMEDSEKKIEKEKEGSGQGEQNEALKNSYGRLKQYEKCHKYVRSHYIIIVLINFDGLLKNF
jgi:hypothetical protein